jgi:hypothetical protein
VLKFAKKDLAIIAGATVLVCCGGGAAVSFFAPDENAAPKPAVTTTAPPRVGIADVPATPTRDLEAERVAASKSAAAYQRRVDAYNAKKAKEAEEARQAEEWRIQEELDAAQDAAEQEENDDSGGSVYYANCSEARAAGAAPLSRSDPGYRRALDRDNDGVACDT